MTESSSQPSTKVLGAAVAGLSELVLFHPIDTVAKRLMTNQSNLNNLHQILFPGLPSSMTIAQRYWALFPGFGFAAVYKISQRIYKFAGQPIVNQFVQTSAMGSVIRRCCGEDYADIATNALAGAVVGVGEVVLLPFDVLKIKSQTNPEALSGRGLFKIVSQEGIRKLYAGAGWTAMRNAPGSLTLFGVNSWTKHSVLGLKEAQKASLVEDLISSSIAGVCSVLVSSPFDVVKTRVQKANFTTDRSGISILKELVRTEGVSGLFKGIVPKLAVVSPKLVFSFTVAKQMISYLEK